jgi:hypothetical protein
MKLLDSPELRFEFFSLMSTVASGYLVGTIGTMLIIGETPTLFAILFRIGFGVIVIFGVPYLFVWSARRMRQRRMRIIQQELNNRQAQNQLPESQEES